MQVEGLGLASNKTEKTSAIPLLLNENNEFHSLMKSLGSINAPIEKEKLSELVRNMNELPSLLKIVQTNIESSTEVFIQENSEKQYTDMSIEAFEKLYPLAEKYVRLDSDERITNDFASNALVDVVNQSIQKEIVNAIKETSFQDITNDIFTDTKIPMLLNDLSKVKSVAQISDNQEVLASVTEAMESLHSLFTFLSSQVIQHPTDTLKSNGEKVDQASSISDYKNRDVADLLNINTSLVEVSTMSFQGKESQAISTSTKNGNKGDHYRMELPLQEGETFSVLKQGSLNYVAANQSIRQNSDKSSKREQEVMLSTFQLINKQIEVVQSFSPESSNQTKPIGKVNSSDGYIQLNKVPSDREDEKIKNSKQKNQQVHIEKDNVFDKKAHQNIGTSSSPPFIYPVHYLDVDEKGEDLVFTEETEEAKPNIDMERTEKVHSTLHGFINEVHTFNQQSVITGENNKPILREPLVSETQNAAELPVDGVNTANPNEQRPFLNKRNENVQLINQTKTWYPVPNTAVYFHQMSQQKDKQVDHPTFFLSSLEMEDESIPTMLKQERSSLNGAISEEYNGKDLKMLISSILSGLEKKNTKAEQKMPIVPKIVNPLLVESLRKNAEVPVTKVNASAQSHGEEKVLDMASKMTTIGQMQLVSNNQETLVLMNESGEQLPNKSLEEQIEKVFSRIQFSKTNNNQRVTLRLAPDHLGTLRIEITKNEGNLIAKIITSSIDAKEVLENQLSSLKHGLHSQNLTVDKVEIVYTPSQQQEKMNRGEQQQSGQQSHANDKQSREEEKQKKEKSFLEELLKMDV